tara:strand:- start:6367 stop:9063 length:2697 start_codon:yes stop_codon:yes gene_type:complete
VLIICLTFAGIGNAYAIFLNSERANEISLNWNADSIEVNLDSSSVNSQPINGLNPDTITQTLPDTQIVNSLKKLVKNPERMESSFKSKVKYHADDSIMIDNLNNKAYLWGKAWVEYESIKLDADYLEIDFAANEVLAKGLPDSTGKIVNTPIFNEKGQEYSSGEMLYNFHSKKGLIKKITTQESSGYIHGETVKMYSQDVFYIKNGRYTTCNLEHPHYYVKSKKLKIINNDKIVTGPAYLAVEEVPTFLAVPFGFFPNQDKRTSGVLVPAIGNSQSKGFSLSNGGYYFGISDQVDLKILGDAYTNGSWSVRAISKYNQRYKRSGSFQFSYTNSKTGEKDEPNYTVSKAFFVNWSHSQDPKARPNSNFTAMVNLGSSNYFQNDLNVSSNNYLRNEFSSNITYTQKFGDSPFTATINASHNQNNVDSTINFVLPNVNLNMSRIYPFKKKVRIGKSKWYEKIGMNYKADFKNQLNLSTTDVFGDAENPPLQDFTGKFNNGVKHQVNTSTSVKLGQFNLSPGISYGETWYFKQVHQAFDSTTYIEGSDTLYGRVVKDTTSAFSRFGNLNLNASIATKIYGIFAFRGEHLKAIRHTITPAVGFSYQPNLSDKFPEYFGETVTDTAGTTKNYTVFDNSVYGTPNGSEMGNVTFQIQNIIEMKRKKRNDTTDAFTNVKLIDAWNFNTSYNMLADSFNWAPMRMDIRARIGKLVNINAGTTSDFYGLKTDSETGTVSRSSNFNYNLTQKPLRLTQFRTSVGLKFSGQSGSNEKDKEEIKKLNQTDNQNPIYQESQYVDFNIPWDAQINYVVTYNKPLDEVSVVNTLNFSGSVNLTPGWKIMMRSSFDFDLNKLGYTTMNVYRDLHCWQIDLSLTPFGTRKSFMVNLKVKQGFLQDLKMTKNSRWFD